MNNVLANYILPGLMILGIIYLVVSTIKAVLAL